MKKGRKILVMSLTKRGMLCVCAIVFLISALVLIALPTSPTEAEAGTNLVGAKLDNLTILHIGGGTPASQLVDHLERAKAHVVRSPNIPEAVELNPEVVIIFGGEWFGQRICDTELHNFLGLASSRGASMVMAGGTTSRFFEALDRAGISKLLVTETGIVRNPAHDNPPLVGLKMKTVGGHTGPSFLFSYGSTPDVLEESLTEWLPLTTSTEDGAPYLRFVREYYYAPLLASDPHGKLNLIADIYNLWDDGTPSHDWYFYQVRLQAVPGVIAYPSIWGYRNEHTWARHQIPYGGWSRWLVDYDPTTTSGTSTTGVSLTAAAGTSGPSVGFTWSWSYSIADVVVLDYSDYSTHTAYWQHDIDHWSPTVGEHTYQSKPGFVVKTSPQSASFIDAWYKVKFVKPLGWWLLSKTLESSKLMLDAYICCNE